LSSANDSDILDINNSTGKKIDLINRTKLKALMPCADNILFSAPIEDAEYYSTNENSKLGRIIVEISRF
jgi:hypothetical protein